MSERTSSDSPRSCSGEANPGVPRIAPGLVALVAALRGRDREAEVADQDPAVAVHEAVRRLDVAVEDPDRRRRLEARDDLQDRVDRRRRRQRRAADQEILERPAGRELHRDHRKALDLGRAEDVDACSDG